MSLSPAKSGQILNVQELNTLNNRNNGRGLIQLAGHLTVLAISGYLWTTTANWLIKLPGLLIYGCSFATMFAPLHEC
ncbi:MAG: fatty acid desaturase, partial [Waterburya sp.]